MNLLPLKLTVVLFLVFSFSQCREKYDPEFYGTYTVNDSSHLLFSRLTFYPGNRYSYFSSSCLASNRDSGEYKLEKNTITFKSFDLYLRDTLTNPIKPLTGAKFVYRANKVYYFKSHTLPDRTTVTDTFFWAKQSLVTSKSE